MKQQISMAPPTILEERAYRIGNKKTKEDTEFPEFTGANSQNPKNYEASLFGGSPEKIGRQSEDSA